MAEQSDINNVSGYRIATVLMRLNWDRVLYFATVGVALWAGAFVGSLIY
ncbi:MAG: hypothetical protein AAF678_04955 [Pseudomonadota bacterium]